MYVVRFPVAFHQVNTKRGLCHDRVRARLVRADRTLPGNMGPVPFSNLVAEEPSFCPDRRDGAAVGAVGAVGGR